MQQVSPATDLIQNGPTDAMYLSNPSGTIIDKVSYEGIVPGYSEGTTAGTDDGVGAQSLSRSVLLRILKLYTQW